MMASSGGPSRSLEELAAEKVEIESFFTTRPYKLTYERIDAFMEDALRHLAMDTTLSRAQLMVSCSILEPTSEEEHKAPHPIKAYD